MSEVVHISEHSKFQGARIPLVSDIIKEEQLSLSGIEAAAASYDSNQEEEFIMDASIKGYIDDRINSLEKSINHRMDSQEKLLSEKIDHLHTKNEKTIKESISEFKVSFDKDRKEDRKFFVTTAIAISAVVVAILGFVF
ncbi:hypothetical protein GCM10011409_43180 [Lentibacillus populi]|uniref:Uncharacterized protein n=1 Tax=Lentibacillus populi TaxID=1827502 RepID=A0A9W5X7K9_9BACI|nr:hypothetical protein [Lentibacillus populi]GGB61300.1 hypothetical protein GCM10011409_43180 [Lentibacillus populi]